MPSREKLSEFVAWCEQHITGDEKSEAQIFLDRLFQAFDQPGCLDVGGTTEFRIRKDKEDGGGTAFADYVWKPVVLVEMKKRGEKLERHRAQAERYWMRLAPNRPRYVVLCNFDEFHVYDFDNDADVPKDTVALKDLPARWGPLAFLAPGSPKPTFENDRETVTRAAADCLAECFRKLVKRGVPQPMAQRFILQMLVALFAEDIDLLPKYFVTQILDECSTPADSYDLIGGLFEAMNTNPPKSGGRFKGVSYFNGGLFREPARLEIQNLELMLLRKAAKFDWSKVQPEVFGTLFQHSMDDDERHAFGAHFTTPSDIKKIVGPTIVEPWREQIESAKTFKRLRELRDRMQTFRVLDPACGSGNFLYIAYREMKRLEARIYERIDSEFPKHASEGQMRFSYLTAKNFYGLDILPFAVEIAKVTMMIARKLAIDELHITEQPLPLDNLDQNFIAADALLTPDGLPAQWPKADVIIGNPPFLDARKMTMEYGREYVGKLEKQYPEVPRRADFCVYWFRKAADHLPPCTAADPTAGHAGLVGTQNIRNNEAREGGLDHVVKTGTIVEAVENQPWSGEANVSVSIADWMKTLDASLLPKKRKLWFKVAPSVTAKKLRKRGSGSATKEYELDVRDCDFINSSLSDQTDVAGAKSLGCNRKPKRCFEGQQPGHEGFKLSVSERNALIKAEDASPILFSYIGATEMLTADYADNPIFIIDFGKRTMLEASAFPNALKIIQERVLADWQKNAADEKETTGKETGEHQGRLETWWQLKRRRTEFLNAIEKKTRYVACSRHMKRPVFAFVSTAFHPDSSLSCFAFDDDYSYGIIQSNPHWLWFITKCGKLTERFRYSVDNIFDTFPWPQFDASPSAVRRDIFVETPAQKRRSSVGATSSEYAAPAGAKSKSTTSNYKDAAPDGAAPTVAALSKDAIAKIDAVAAAAREVRRVRAEALRHLKGGLRALYRTLELPGANPLKDAHAALDAAVLAAYGFSAKKDLLAQLLVLNQQVAAKIEQGEPVISPGIPKNYPNAEKLVTKDCIQPTGAEPPADTIAKGKSTAESEAAAAHFYSIHEKPVPYRTK